VKNGIVSLGRVELSTHPHRDIIPDHGDQARESHAL
ncbi:MAG: hypothetical protein RLZZ224_1213, partial [Verrucomicrobiota bacterium]